MAAMKPSALLLLLASAAFGQQPAPPAPAPLVSPQVLPDHRVVFQLRAPKASDVTISADFYTEENHVGHLVKDDQGVWSITSDPLPPGYYSYNFTVDGIRIPDPADPLTKPGISATQSAFWVPGPEAGILEPGNVPHGEVRQVYYQAAALGKLQRMYIYFPPEYEAGKSKYPVLYLFHGGDDDDWGWVDIGRMNFILDNLIAQGKAKPMIVVMPSLWALDPPVHADREAENEQLFEKSLIGDIIPYVERHYRALTGPANRAIGGLGAGRDMMGNIVWPEIANFDYVGFTSGGADAQRVAALDKQYPGVLDNPANIKRVHFFVGNGSHDNSWASASYLAQHLKDLGYNTTFYHTDDIHGWPGFRRYFIQFAQVVFQ
jgi:enterochelin esterase-like enzyme